MSILFVFINTENKISTIQTFNNFKLQEYYRCVSRKFTKYCS